MHQMYAISMASADLKDLCIREIKMAESHFLLFLKCVGVCVLRSFSPSKITDKCWVTIESCVVYLLPSTHTLLGILWMLILI